MDLDGLPPSDLPEIAFWGRSNVGKSSLINALTNRRQLARTSGDPGRTRELNFFVLGDAIRLVDLPGYGFAKAPKAKVEAWTRLTRQFLRGRATLRRVFVLIDSRHGLKPVDTELMDMLGAAQIACGRLSSVEDLSAHEFLRDLQIRFGDAEVAVADLPVQIEGERKTHVPELDQHGPAIRQEFGL